jgi:FAD:protein FMN transferase
VLELALDAREATGGRFDPTIHDALVEAGYDRTFAEVPAALACDTVSRARGGGRIDLDGSRVTLAPGVRVDLGGIGKGYAAERACEILALAGPCLVSAGGDVAVRGVPADSGVWPVGVADGLTLGLDAGGLATSGRDRRRWRRGGRELHHLIDPATGRPAATDIARLTVVADDAVAAEVLATSLFVAGSTAAVAADVPAVVVTDDGRTLVTGGLA